MFLWIQICLLSHLDTQKQFSFGGRTLHTPLTEIQDYLLCPVKAFLKYVQFYFY